MTTDNFCFYLQNRLFETSQTGGQWYSDIFLFSIPCFSPHDGDKKFYNVKTRPGLDIGVIVGNLKKSENTKGGSITVPLTSCLTGLD